MLTNTRNTYLPMKNVTSTTENNTCISAINILFSHFQPTIFNDHISPNRQKKKKYRIYPSSKALLQPRPQTRYISFIIPHTVNRL